ncbi:uncharacterized protein LOC143026534 [Oratosquilla oratoria]|uniref:uncharacterized protein LOC143026534 n=1 Tax=Oratosquilla oratoria TaxID=337810 RepID=UPI003F76106A
MARLPFFRFLSSIFFATSFVCGSPHYSDQTERKADSPSHGAIHFPFSSHGQWALPQEERGGGGGGGRGDEEGLSDVIRGGRWPGRLRGVIYNGAGRDKRAYEDGGGVRVERGLTWGDHHTERPQNSLGDAVDLLTQKVVRLTDRLVRLEEGLDSRLAALEEGIETRLSETVQLEDTLVTALTSRLTQVDALVRKVDTLDSRLTTETADLRSTVTHTNRDVQSAVAKLAHLEGFWRERAAPARPEERDAAAAGAPGTVRSLHQGNAGLQEGVVKGVEAALDTRHHTLLWNLRKVISNEFVVLREDFNALRKENDDFKEEMRRNVVEVLEAKKATVGTEGEEEGEREEKEEEEPEGSEEKGSLPCAHLEAMLTEVHRNWSDAFRRVGGGNPAGGEALSSLPTGQGIALHVLDQRTFRHLVNQSLQRLASGSDVDSLLLRLQQRSPMDLEEPTTHPKGGARISPPEDTGGGGGVGGGGGGATRRLAKANESSEEHEGSDLLLRLLNGRQFLPLSGPACPTFLLDPSTMGVLNEIKTLLRSLLTKNEVLYRKLQEVSREELEVLTNIQKRVSVLVRRMDSEPRREVGCDVVAQVRSIESLVRNSYSSLALAQEAFMLSCRRIQDQEPSLEERIAELLDGLLSNIKMGHEFSRIQLEELQLLVQGSPFTLEGQSHTTLATAADDASTRLQGVMHKIDSVKNRILTRDWILTGQKEYADDLLTAAKDLQGLAQDQVEALLTLQSTFVETDDNSTVLNNLEECLRQVDFDALIGRLQEALSNTPVVKQIMADQGKKSPSSSYPSTSRELAFSCHRAVVESLRSFPTNTSSSSKSSSNPLSDLSADVSKNVDEGDDDDEMYDEEDVPAWYFDPDILSGNFGTPDHEFPLPELGWTDQFPGEEEEEEHHKGGKEEEEEEDAAAGRGNKDVEEEEEKEEGKDKSKGSQAQGLGVKE